MRYSIAQAGPMWYLKDEYTNTILHHSLNKAECEAFLQGVEFATLLWKPSRY
ncbi:hypothetical protein K12P11_LOCUS15 [Klebsiella phage vB_Kpn_K12P1.1]|uniref:Uncharacterized protein n=1 Tax=Klebsiella phage vB_Kpn_K12P1.1 TaxID=3071627 RepID=A0AAV1MEB3_9CAUD|nr:hypothetical protein K12P11_LOCUS15 [Klebsiella phage vB_Kpn_K12P1.1]